MDEKDSFHFVVIAKPDFNVSIASISCGGLGKRGNRVATTVVKGQKKIFLHAAFLFGFFNLFIGGILSVSIIVFSNACWNLITLLDVYRHVKFACIYDLYHQWLSRSDWPSISVLLKQMNIWSTPFCPLLQKLYNTVHIQFIS